MKRFWDKVDKSGDCWVWTAYLGTHGYGSFKLDGKMRRAQRVAFQLTRGPIPDGMCVLHACDNRTCVNPDHLWLGTHGDNNTDRAKKGRSHSVLCETDVMLIRDLAVTQSHGAIARWFGVAQPTISRIMDGTGWTHV